MFGVYFANLLNIYSRVKKLYENGAGKKLFAKDIITSDDTIKSLKDEILEYFRSGNDDKLNDLINKLRPVNMLTATLATQFATTDNLSLSFLNGEVNYTPLFKGAPMNAAGEESDDERALVECTLATFLAEYTPSANINGLKEIITQIHNKFQKHENIQLAIAKFRILLPIRVSIASSANKLRWNVASFRPYLIYIAIIAALIIVIVIILVFVLDKKL